MQAGKLRQKISIQSPTVNQNPYQTASASAWTEVASVWSCISSASNGNTAKLITGAGLTAAQVSHAISIRYPGTAFVVKEGYQAVYNNGGQLRTFSILRGIINTDERNRELVLLAWEIDPVQGGVQA
jgi:head-tail adaptor